MRLADAKIGKRYTVISLNYSDKALHSELIGKTIEIKKGSTNQVLICSFGRMQHLLWKDGLELSPIRQRVKTKASKPKPFKPVAINELFYIPSWDDTKFTFAPLALRYNGQLWDERCIKAMPVSRTKKECKVHCDELNACLKRLRK